MRIEATTEEWRRLYELAMQYKKMKPWEEYWSSDIMAVKLPEGTAYFSIMGKLGDCIGLSLYQDNRGYNDLAGVVNSEELGVEFDYIMLEQNCITMYMSDREEVPKEQYKVIRQLNLRFRGRGNWIYFETYEKGFFPYIPNQAEVQVYIKYLEKLLDSLSYCEKYGCSADFEEKEIFMYFCKNGEWTGEAMEPPSEGYCYEGPIMQDDIMAAKLKKAAKKRTSAILETDMFYLRNGITDEKFDKPFIPKLAVLADHQSGMILNQQLLSPGDDDISCLTQMLSAWILKHGAPKKVIVKNLIMQVLIEDLCEKCRIELVSDELDVINDCRRGLLGYMSGDIEEEDEMFDISPEDQQMMAELFEAAGIDLDEMRERAMNMTEEEFNAEMMSQLMGFVDQMGGWDIQDD